MKYVLALALLAICAFANYNDEAHSKLVANVAAMKQQMKELKDLQQCLTDIQTCVGTLETIEQDAENKEFVKLVEDGLEEAKDIDQAVKDCSNAELIKAFIRMKK